jgi:dephospho-CoA kinase
VKGRNKPLVGITGIIGSGKSAAARYFAELGAAVFDADCAAREVTEKPEVLEEIRQKLGSHLLTPDGKLDRSRTAEEVFSSSEKLAILNRIIHPRVRERMWDFVQANSLKPDIPMIVLDVPLIYETDLHRYLDFVVVVAAPEEECVRRTMQRSRLSREEVLRRMHHQLPLNEKIRRADFVLDNSASLEHLKKQVERVFRDILARWREG